MNQVFTRTRLSLTCWYAAVMGLILLAAAGAFLIVVYRSQVHGLDHSLQTWVTSFAQTQEAEHLEEHQFILEKLGHDDMESDLQEVKIEDSFIHWYDRQGHLRWERGPMVPKSNPVTLGFATVGDYRQLTVQVPEGILQVGFSLDEAQELWHQVLVGLLVAIPLLEVLVGVAAWFLAGRAMVPIQNSYLRLQQFTADASHELRNPVSTVLATAQGALGHPLPQPTQTALTAIVHTAQRMGQLTEDLLWLARADNRPAKPLEPCSLKDILGDLEEELAALALAKNLTVTCQLPEQDLKVMGDKAQLYRLFINLITNAIKYTPPEGNVKITLSFTNHTLVEIHDSGIGIAPEHLPHLFERFYRVDEARTASGGTGLGLAIARTICETHGGEITVQSTLGQGSLFRVFLPLGEGDDGNFRTLGDRGHPRL